MPHLFSLMTRILPLVVLLLATPVARALAHEETPSFASKEELDLYCLKASYPDIQGSRVADDGSVFLVIANGHGVREVLYAPPERPDTMPEHHVADVRTSMRLPYPLEPSRPDLPDRFSPGRWRSMKLITALYGDSRESVQRNLVRVPLQGQGMTLAPAVAEALRKVDRELSAALADDKSIGKFLVMGTGGGYVWRRVVGEDYMSPHAYGIAIDLNPQEATYWRWSKLRPHPLQKTYPAAIVGAFERHGFIWGGKWHEYDLMHFEYRPELICKARHMRQGMAIPSP